MNFVSFWDELRTINWWFYTTFLLNIFPKTVFCGTQNTDNSIIICYKNLIPALSDYLFFKVLNTLCQKFICIWYTSLPDWLVK